MTDTTDPPRRVDGRFAPVHPWEVHIKVRADYEASSLTLREICDKHRVGASAMHQWARREGWTMRKPQRIDPNDLVGRMLELLDGQIAELEATVTTGATEVAMLGKLVATLDRVLMLKVRSNATERPRSSKRVEALRAQIAERIGELNRA
jgi:hypothetical protein